MAIARTSIEDCITAGEKLIFTFFKDKLSDDYMFWNNLEITYGDQSNSTRRDRELDFLVYHDDLGFFYFLLRTGELNRLKALRTIFFI